MAATLPRFLVLYSESAGKYVTYVSDDGQGGELSRILAAKGSQVTGPMSKFEVVRSQAHPSMVHIRCCYNNRFLTRRSETEWWIVAASEKPVDDLSQWSSTLFLPEFVAGVVRLLHVQLGRYAEWYNDSSHPYSMCIWAQSASLVEPKAEFQVIDWETLVTLPNRLSFRGDNGLYVGVGEGLGAALRFLFDDPGTRDERVVHEVVVQPNGSVMLKHVAVDAFWWCLNDNVYVEKNTTTPPRSDFTFRAIKVNENTVALRNMGNGMFCQRDKSEYQRNRMRADGSQGAPETELVLTGLVPSRRIEDIKFHLADSWVSNVTPEVVIKSSDPVKNETGETQTIKVSILYEEIIEVTWKATNTSFALGPRVEVKPGGIPYVIGPSTIEMTTPPASSYVWGETTQGVPNKVKVHEVTLPPWTMVIVKLLATVATCDVPLTYTRYDIFDEAKGEGEVHIMEDGVYTGINCFDFKFEESAPNSITKI